MRKDFSVVEEIEEDLNSDDVAYLEEEDLGMQGIETKEAIFIKKHVKHLTH